MVKAFILIGIVVLAVGLGIALTLVVPYIGHLPTRGLNASPPTLSLYAVPVAAVGLAAGASLIGLGVSSWRYHG